MGCATGAVKYLVFIFNLIFALAGLAILVIGILFKVNVAAEILKADDMKFMSTVAIVFIVIGAIIFIISFFGCCGAIRESSCMLTTYAVILLGLFIMQIAIGIFMFIEVKDEAGLKKLFVQDFEEDVKKYNNGDSIAIAYMDSVQKTSHCCGAHGPADWKWDNNTLPASCCIDQQSPCRFISSHVYSEGCADKVFNEIIVNVKRIGIVAIAIAVTELVGSIFALCLSSSIRNQYRRGVYA